MICSLAKIPHREKRKVFRFKIHILLSTSRKKLKFHLSERKKNPTRLRISPVEEAQVLKWQKKCPIGFTSLKASFILGVQPPRILYSAYFAKCDDHVCEAFDLFATISVSIFTTFSVFFVNIIGLYFS